MPAREVARSETGRLCFEFTWLDSPQGLLGPTYGDLVVRLGGDPIWTAPADDVHGEGATGLWIELLEYLSAYWLYLVLEQGYPFHRRPTKPSELDRELYDRWENSPDELQAKEEQEAYAFKVSHNLAESSPGALRPDIWFVRNGGIFVVEAQVGTQTMVERLPAAEVIATLAAVGDAIAVRLAAASDPRSVAARAAWQIRERADLGEQARIATGLGAPYLEAVRGSAPLAKTFADPGSSWAGDNVCFDLAYRCKGIMPAERMREVLERTRETSALPSGELHRLSEEASNELAEVASETSKPYAEGQAIARWLRDRVVDSDARVDPDQLLDSWGVLAGPYDFAVRSIDAVAFWQHGRNPTVLWNCSEKHTENEGARRATLAHEICHLLVDRPDALPLAAVVGGAMERRLEQRANAFAAELLCPRSASFAEFHQEQNVESALHALTIRFGVSDQLAAIQLARSGYGFNLASQRAIEQFGPPGARYPWS